MCAKLKSKALPFFVIVSVLGLLATSCDPWHSITYVNQTSSTIKVDLSLVSVDYAENPTLTWNDPGVLIGAGESKKYLTPIPDTRKGGIRYKYAVAAVIDTNVVVFSKVFTWDELNDMNWTIIIKLPPN